MWREIIITSLKGTLQILKFLLKSLIIGSAVAMPILVLVICIVLGITEGISGSGAILVVILTIISNLVWGIFYVQLVDNYDRRKITKTMENKHDTS